MASQAELQAQLDRVVGQLPAEYQSFGKLAIAAILGAVLVGQASNEDDFHRAAMLVGITGLLIEDEVMAKGGKNAFLG